MRKASKTPRKLSTAVAAVLKTRVIGYVRISPRPEEGLSIEAQTAKLRHYCEATGLELVDVVADNLRSGKDLDRPGLRQALMSLRVGEADGILVVKLDRLTRSVRDLGDLIEEYFAEDKPFSLHCMDFGVDTRTSTGRAMLNLMMSMAQWQRESTVERTREVLAYARDNLGVKLGGLEYGQQRTRVVEGERCVVETNSAEAAAIARIEALSAAGLSVRAIAERLDAEGVAPRQNTKNAAKRWHPTQVQRVLSRARKAA